MMQGTEIPNMTGPVFVICDNPDHRNKRFATEELAASYLRGNAVFADCLSAHRVVNYGPACRQVEKELASQQFADLLASCLPVEGDDDDCERGL